MPSRNVNLTEHYDNFITAGIEVGRYGNASEVVRAALRLLERQEQEEQAKIEWLRGVSEAAFAALDRGEGIALRAGEDIDAFVDGIIVEARVGRNTPHA